MKDRSELAAKIEQLKAAPEACADLKAACAKWLEARGTADEKAASAALLAEIEADITTIDGLIAFAGSERGASILGAEKAKTLTDLAKKAKADGAKYCICSACALCAEILEHKDWLN